MFSASLLDSKCDMTEIIFFCWSYIVIIYCIENPKQYKITIQLIVIKYCKIIFFYYYFILQSNMLPEIHTFFYIFYMVVLFTHEKFYTV